MPASPWKEVSSQCPACVRAVLRPGVSRRLPAGPGLLSDSGLAWRFPTAILGWGQGRGLVRAPQDPVPHPGRNGVPGTQETSLALKGGEDLSGCVCPQKGAGGLLEGWEWGKPARTIGKPHLVWNQRCQCSGSHHSSFSFEGLSARNHLIEIFRTPCNKRAVSTALLRVRVLFPPPAVSVPVLFSCCLGDEAGVFCFLMKSFVSVGYFPSTASA